MRTAQEMYDYTLKNKYGTGIVKSFTRKHFDVVEEQLQDGERVSVSFVGLHEQQGSGLGGNFAYAITNKRLIMGQRGVLGRDKTKTVLIEHLNDITIKNSMTWRIIEIDTIKDHFLIKNNTRINKKLGLKVQEAIFALKEKGTMDNKESTTSTNIEQIREYQQLMEEGIITEEEFEQKKKQLLNI